MEAPPYTIFERDADLVLIEDREYSFTEAMNKIQEILNATDAGKKKKWLYKLIRFRTKLQGDGVSILIKVLNNEPSGEVRLAILQIIHYSRDRRFNDICAGLKGDPSPLVRLLIASSLLKKKDGETLNYLTEALNNPDFPLKVKEEAWDLLSQAVRQFKLTFKLDEPPKSVDVSFEKKMASGILQWNKWWSKAKETA